MSSLNQDYHTGRRCGRYFIAALGNAFEHNTNRFSHTLAQKIESNPLDIQLEPQVPNELIPELVAEPVTSMPLAAISANENRDG